MMLNSHDLAHALLARRANDLYVEVEVETSLEDKVPSERHRLRIDSASLTYDSRTDGLTLRPVESVWMVPDPEDTGEPIKPCPGPHHRVRLASGTEREICARGR